MSDYIDPANPKTQYPLDGETDHPYDDYQEQDGPLPKQDPDYIREAGNALDNSDLNNYIWVSGKKYDLRTVGNDPQKLEELRQLGILWDIGAGVWRDFARGNLYYPPNWTGVTPFDPNDPTDSFRNYSRPDEAPKRVSAEVKAAYNRTLDHIVKILLLA